MRFLVLGTNTRKPNAQYLKPTNILRFYFTVYLKQNSGFLASGLTYTA